MRPSWSLIALSAAQMLAGTAGAEPPIATTPLWGAMPATVPAVDIDPSRPGVELPTFARQRRSGGSRSFQ